MGLFDRLVDLVKSNVNDAVDRAEDPEKMIKLMVVEMQEAIVKATSSLAQAMGNRNRLEKQYNAYKAKSDEWQQKAMKALEAGNEDLARQALAKKSQADQSTQQYQHMFEQAKATTAKLKEQVDQLKAKLDEAKMKEQMLIARSQHADAQADIAKKIGGLNNSSFAKFDKFEDKIMKKEAEAQAFSELSDDSTSLDDQFKELEKNSAVDDELAKLKAQMNS